MCSLINQMLLLPLITILYDIERPGIRGIGLKLIDFYLHGKKVEN